MKGLFATFFREPMREESSGGICRRSSLTDYNILYGCVMFQPLFDTFHVISARYNRLIYVYRRKTGAFIAIYPIFQGTDTPRFHVLKMSFSMSIGSPKVTIIASNVVLSGSSSKYFNEPKSSAFRPKDQS